MKQRFFVYILIVLIGLQAPSFVMGASINEPIQTKKVDSIMVKYRQQSSAINISLTGGESVDKALARYSKNPAVEYAEPNYIYHASLIPSDTHYTNQWYLKRIRASEAWNYSSASPAVVIAVIDSGVQINHPDLAANIWKNPKEVDNKKDDDKNGLVDDIYGWDFINNVADPSPKFKPGFTEAGVLHGTIIAGLAAAVGNNEQGVTGVTWSAQIMSLKALDDAGNGDTATVVKAIDYAVAKGANIINLSFVGFSYSQSLKDALQRAADAEVIVVAPAGNEESAGHGVNLNKKPIYPACYKDNKNKPLVIGVAATDALDQKAVFSGYGNECIALSAPGISAYTTSVYAPGIYLPGKSFNQYYDGYWSGTSVAVPMVSGALALVQGANPTLSPLQSVQKLINSTDDINALNPEYINQLGKGRLNVLAAVSSATAPLRSKLPRLVIAPVSRHEPFVKILDANGLQVGEFLAYDRSHKGGVTLAAGDFDNDGNDEIITAPASDLEADIKIFDKDGTFLRHFLAYPATYRGGVNLAVADLNSDGKYEIITAPASGIQSEIKIFTSEGKFINSFLAYPASFKGGASVAVGNVMGGSALEIVVGTGKSGVPQIKIFSESGVLLGDFLADKKDAATGLRVALLDIDNNVRRRQSEILISKQSESTKAMITDFRGNIRREWLMYSPSFKGDVKSITADLNHDGVKEIISFPGVGGGPHVRIFDHLGNFKNSFYAYSPDFEGGVNVAAFYIQP